MRVKVIARLALGLALGFVSASAYLASLASPSVAPVKGDGADLAGTTTTGIYRIATFSPASGRRYDALMLTRKGTVVEVHSQRSSGGYLRRDSTSSAIRLSTSQFDQLLQIAAANVDVERLSQAQRDRYYQLAGFSSSGSRSMPTEVSPGTGSQCPAGYELKLILKDGRRQAVCRIIAQAVPRPEPVKRAGIFDLLSPPLFAGEPAVAGGSEFWNRLRFVPSVEAKLEFFSFRLSKLFGEVTFTYDTGAGYGGQTQMSGWSFNGFGFTIVWVDGP